MSLKNRKILTFVADEYEDLELQYPRLRLIEAGAHVVVAGTKGGEVYKGKHGYPCTADVAFDDVNPDDFDGLVIPGGYAPDKLRKIPSVIEIIKHFNKKKRLIAFICHAGWLPISAKILKDVKCTSYASIKDDMINAGAKWVNESVVEDRHFISSRFPDDLPNFCRAIIKHFEAN